MNAVEILKLLAEKHAQDVFVPECKTGPTPCPTLDAWAMTCSWAHPASYGYEIKVTRSDWLRDAKWDVKYLGLVNYFSIVCPKGVALVSELPDGVGLIHVASTGRSLVTARKAARAAVPTLDPRIAQYVLQSRVRIKAPGFGRESDLTRSERIAKWIEWLDEKQSAMGVGYRVQGRIKQAMRELEQRADDALARAERAEEIEKACEKLGLSLRQPHWNIERYVRQHLAPVSEEVIRELRNAQRALTAALEKAGE